jgi:hypothetical protein
MLSFLPNPRVFRGVAVFAGQSKGTKIFAPEVPLQYGKCEGWDGVHDI